MFLTFCVSVSLGKSELTQSGRGSGQFQFGFEYFILFNKCQILLLAKPFAFQIFNFKRIWKRQKVATWMEEIQLEHWKSESPSKKNPEKSSPRFNNDKMVLARNVGIKLLLLILDSGDRGSKTETLTQQMVAKH